MAQANRPAASLLLMSAEFSPITVLASAAISVFVSSVMSLLLVPVVAVRQARAQQREQARQRLAGVARRLMLDLDRYEERLIGGRKPETGVGDDSETAAAVLRAAAGLGRFRSWLVLRRCRSIFGQHWLSHAVLYPGEDEGHERFNGMLFGQIRSRGENVDLTSHALHQAYATPPGGRAQRVLAHHLKRLARAR